MQTPVKLATVGALAATLIAQSGAVAVPPTNLLSNGGFDSIHQRLLTMLAEDPAQGDQDESFMSGRAKR